ncbi:MAG: hypothetical protein ACO3JL_03840 [Myxococcota bacterium]
MSTGPQRVASFVANFLSPFIDGGDCCVTDPLGVDGHKLLHGGLRFEAAVDEARASLLAQAALLTDIVPAPFDEDAVTLLYACHELAAACHPQAASFYSRAHRYCLAAEQAVLRLERTYEPGRVLARHVLMARLFSMTRIDTKLTWWTGTTTYHGEEPPARMTAWPSLRRVQQERTNVPLWQLASLHGDEELRLARLSLLSTLLNVSPLTRLLLLGDAAQRSLGFSLLLPLKCSGRRMSPVYLLDEPRLARLVSDVLLERGVGSTGPMLAHAILAAVREPSPPLALRRAVELCVHLAFLMCVVEVEVPRDETAAPLRALCDADVRTLNDAMRVYWATVSAALLLDGTHLRLPLRESHHPALDSVLARLNERLRHPYLATIGEPLYRELCRRLPPLEATSMPAEGLSPS